MIRFKFFRSPEAITGFDIKGHAEYGEKGNDIVCAAVSSAAYLTANTLTDFLHADASVSVQEDGRMTLHLESDSQAARQVLKGLEHHIKMLSEQYPNSIKVIYGGNTNA